MMKKTGFIQIPNASLILETSDARLLLVYVTITKRVRRTHKTIPWHGSTVELAPGQFITGRFALGSLLHIPPSTIRNKLAKLEALGIIEKVSKITGGTIWQFCDTCPPSSPKKVDANDSRDTCPPPPPKKVDTNNHVEEQPTSDIKTDVLKKKKNPHTPLWIENEDMVVPSNPIIQELDVPNALARFAENASDYLIWLMEQAKSIAKISPVGLFVHWLKTGKMVSLYADILKSRKKSQELKKTRLLEARSKADKEKQNQKTRMESLAREQHRIQTLPEAMDSFLCLLNKARLSRYAGRWLSGLTTFQVLADSDLLEMVLSFSKVVQS